MQASATTTTVATTAAVDTPDGGVSPEFPESVGSFEKEDDDCPLLEAWFSGDPGEEEEEEREWEGQGVERESKEEKASRLLRSWWVCCIRAHGTESGGGWVGG